MAPFQKEDNKEHFKQNDVNLLKGFVFSDSAMYSLVNQELRELVLVLILLPSVGSSNPL